TAITAFPEAFPSWAWLVVLAIAIITLGAWATLIWGDVAKLASTIGVKRTWIGPAVAVVGVSIILAIAIYFLATAPAGAFEGWQPIAISLLAAVFLFFYVGLLQKKLAALDRTELDELRLKSAELDRRLEAVRDGLVLVKEGNA